MMHPIRYNIYLALIGGLATMLTACHKRVEPTDLIIPDPVRHYYPLVQGEDLRMNYLIVNAGKSPFIIQDVQPSTLSIELGKTPPNLVPAGDSAYISLIFHTDRNIGYAKHKIRIFGNIVHVNDSTVEGEAVLTFDTHIVHPTLDQSDYEERYWAKKAANEKLVDGLRGEQGYFTDAERLDQ